MKMFFGILLLSLIAAPSVEAQTRRVAQTVGQINRQVKRPLPQKQQSLRPGLTRPNAAAARPPVPIEDMVEGFYVSRFQAQMQVSDEQFTRILPVLRESLSEMRSLATRKRRALNQLANAIRNNEPDETLQRMSEEVDRTDQAFLAVQQKMQSDLDPLLTISQRARFRVFRDRIDQQIRQMINSVTAPPGP
jgi:hypothetical protein